MRVAFLAHRFPEVSQTFVVDQVTGILERGLDVHVFRRERGSGDLASMGDQLSGRVHDLQSPLPSRRDRWVKAASTAASLAGRLPAVIGRALATPDSHVPRSSTLSFIADLERHGGFSIVHAQFGTMGRLAAPACYALRGRTSLITSFHGFDVSRYPAEHGPDVYKRLFDTGSLFLPVSERWGRRLVDLGCPPARTIVHRMGVPVAALPFHPRVPTNGLRVVSVGRLVEKKGFEFGVRAVARMRDSGVGVTYDIVGDGPLGATLRSIASDLGLDGVVSFQGAQPRSQALEAIRRAHVLLAPSVTASDGDQEGIPVVLMEALALGTPVVASRHSGIPEIIHDGVTGLVRDESDVDGLADALTELLSNHRLYISVAEAGRDVVEQRHDIERLNDRLVELYEQTTRMLSHLP